VLRGLPPFPDSERMTSLVAESATIHDNTYYGEAPSRATLLRQSFLVMDDSDAASIPAGLLRV
jgi:hypothetical protein